MYLLFCRYTNLNSNDLLIDVIILALTEEKPRECDFKLIFKFNFKITIYITF